MINFIIYAVQTEHGSFNFLNGGNMRDIQIRIQLEKTTFLRWGSFS